MLNTKGGRVNLSWRDFKRIRNRPVTQIVINESKIVSGVTN
jgi:hypothetical protein